jgi:hypothetical protein
VGVMLPKEIQQSRLIGIDKRLKELSEQKQELSDGRLLTIKIKDLLATKRNITRLLEEAIHMIDKDTGNDSVFEDDIISIPKRYKDIYDNTI